MLKSLSSVSVVVVVVVLLIDLSLFGFEVLKKLIVLCCTKKINEKKLRKKSAHQKISIRFVLLSVHVCFISFSLGP